MEMEIVNCFWDWMAQLSWRLFILMEKSNNPLCSLDKVLFPYFLRINILFASVGWFSEKVFLKKELYDKLQNSSTRDFLISSFCILRVCRYACAFWTDLHACSFCICVHSVVTHMSPCTGCLLSESQLVVISRSAAQLTALLLDLENVQNVHQLHPSFCCSLTCTYLILLLLNYDII